MYLYHISVDGQLDYFHILGIVNSFAVNIMVHISFQIIEFLSFLDICPGMGLLDCMVILVLIFEGTSILFFTMAALVYILTISIGETHTLSSVFTCGFFGDGHSDWCEVHCGFDLHFSSNQ